MSYILDALKKLEKERKRGRIPGLNEQDSVVYHSQKRPVWPYLLAGAFILNAAILIWWFMPRARNTVMPATPANVASPAPANIPLAVPPVQQLTAPAVSQDTAKPEDKGSGNVISSGVKDASSTSLSPAAPPAQDAGSRDRLKTERKMPQEETRKAAGPAMNEPKPENEKQKKTEVLRQETKPEVIAEPVPEKKLYKLSELPSTVRSGLPGFSITAFLYSESPSGRMARINERMMREGQELEPGIRIEEIVPDGVIMSYKKFRFFVSPK